MPDLSGKSQQLECLPKRQEDWNGRNIRMGQKGVFEIDLKEHGVRVPALDVGLQKQESKSADAGEHDYRLEEYRRNSLHPLFS
jgi:hypothetical protein